MTERYWILELNRPATKNSLNTALLSALNSELAAVRNDDTVRAVVLTGSGGIFCAGADIADFDAIREEALLGDRASVGGNIFTDLGRFPKPVLAAVEGLALGGGCELALACDIVIAGESAKFAVPEVKLGVIPGGGGTQRLVQAAGKSTAMALLLTGDVVSAQRACAAGIVAETVADGSALEVAVAMAKRIAKNSPLAVALAKDAAITALETSLAQGLEHEKRNFHVAIHSADCREGQAAFLAKRAPEFTGK
ncbi:enoyl-CoA hydratase/isomerase family protein [[Mycobacterium] crassicus]|uniref:Enoyl-CoA hydratase-related protein n=1 Tax=[Mycobacterium] crassicus TaxID=2872309 RepID=A0ABU5XKX4_9MYCO|nr:enoyl-CoA hydratase-related protein [Mycolicibacter sp. MYC098]MEB3022828.1 enoyl-CoA hydratase-related protein [Mycolicibacter sp. MYC098]